MKRLNKSLFCSVELLHFYLIIYYQLLLFQLIYLWFFLFNRCWTWLFYLPADVIISWFIHQFMYLSAIWLTTLSLYHFTFVYLDLNLSGAHMWPNLLCLGKHSIQLKIKKKNIKIQNELIGPNVQLTAVGKFNGQQK